MITFYAWIPHITPSFESVWTRERFIRNLRIGCGSSDTDTSDTFCSRIEADDLIGQKSNVIILRFEVPPNFDFANSIDSISGDPILVSVCPEFDDHNVRLRAEVYVSHTGLMIINVPDIEGFTPEMTDPEFKEFHSMYNATASEHFLICRRYCREIFLKFKSIFHKDIHHNPNDGTAAGGPADADEMCFTLSFGASLDETLDMFRDRIIQTLQNSLESLGSFYRLTEHRRFRDGLRIWERKDFLFHKRYCYINGYISYGRFFMNLFRAHFKSTCFEKTLESIDRYEESVNTLYNAHNNDDNHRLSFTIQVLTVMTVAIGLTSILIGLQRSG